MTAQEKVKVKYPQSYAAGSLADGKFVAFIFNPDTHGPATLSESFDSPEKAWEDAAKKLADYGL